MTIRNAMTPIDLAKPTRFLTLTARLLRWLAALTAVLPLIGLYQAAAAPDDYQQGALLFVTLHLAAMRNEILRRRVRALQMMQTSRRPA
jgi:ABC-type transport system involved in cytochrome c biogenesis permease subunit